MPNGLDGHPPPDSIDERLPAIQMSLAFDPRAPETVTDEVRDTLRPDPWLVPADDYLLRNGSVSVAEFFPNWARELWPVHPLTNIFLQVLQRSHACRWWRTRRPVILQHYGLLHA